MSRADEQPRRDEPRPKAEAPGSRKTSALREIVPFLHPRGWRLAAAVVAVLAILAIVASFLIDEPIRRSMERRMNASLKGYSVVLPGLKFHPVGLSVTLRDLTIRQTAHPETPVAQFPLLHASIEWKQLLTLHLVADFLLKNPRLHIDLRQLRAEVQSPVPVKEEGWQQAVEAIYPLKINLLRVENADLVYVDEDPDVPLRVTRLNIRAQNIRNIHSRDRVYPSPLHADGIVFDRGRAALDGHADFLAEPYPGVHALFHFSGVPLDPFRPILGRSNLRLRGGVLATSGEIEYSPRIDYVDVRDAEIRGLRADFVHSPATAANEKEKKAAVKRAAAKVTNAPGTFLRIARLRFQDSELGLVNEAHAPSYRAYLSRVDLEIRNLSNRFSGGPARARLSGQFLGSGQARATATFRTENAGPDLDLHASIEHADLTRMNDILRAYGKFDVAEGDFSFYSELRVRRGELSGYMKPLFANIKVYSPEQDRGKSFGKKLYERVVAGVATLLKSHREKAVATEVKLSGRLDNPQESFLQILGKALENAFLKAILPGFDRELARLK
jgi:hypothetical protein